MILKIALYSASLLFVAGCAANSGFQTTQTFTPAQFQVNDVYVNMVDGVENSNRARGLMRNAGKNTARVYNDAIGSTTSQYPLEIEVMDINYRNPNASATSGERTYIKYTATLREEASGEVFRSLPVTYYHVSAEKLDNEQAKQNAEKNMIRLSIKNAFARLYGMKEVPQPVQRHFATQDIFSQSNGIQTKPVIKPQNKPAPAPVIASAVPTQPAVKPAPEPVIAAPAEAITETTTVDGATVIKCAVC